MPLVGSFIVSGIDEFKDSFACEVVCKIKYRYCSEKMSSTFIRFSRVGLRTTYLEGIQRSIIDVKKIGQL